MKPFSVLLVLLLAFGGGYLGAFGRGQSPGLATAHESAGARVVRTRVLRCAYTVWPPFIDKDIVTGQTHGLYADYTEAVAKHLGLKVVWAATVITGQETEPLRAGKADALCLHGAWNGAANLAARFLAPVLLDAVGIFARTDDSRFDDPRAINQSTTRFAAIDGDVSQDLAQTHFPAARFDSLPQAADNTMLVQDVLARKADLTIIDKWLAQHDRAINGVRLKQVGPQPALAYYAVSFGVLPEDEPLANLLSQATRDLRNTGLEDSVFRPYDQLFRDGALARISGDVSLRRF